MNAHGVAQTIAELLGCVSFRQDESLAWIGR